MVVKFGIVYFEGYMIVIVFGLRFVFYDCELNIVD